MSGVRRVATVLRAFEQLNDNAGVTQIARSVGMSKSVVHRILAELVSEDFVRVDDVSHQYRLGPMIARLATRTLDPVELPEVALPFMQRVRDRTGESAVLSVLRGEHRYYAAQIESRERIHQSILVGEEGPLERGSGGKAILAFLAPIVRTRVVDQARRRSGERAAATLLRDLERVRRRGYAVSLEEMLPGAVGVAAPIFGPTGVVGSMSVAGISLRSEATRLSRHARIVRDEASGLSRQLGGRSSTSALRNEK